MALPNYLAGLNLSPETQARLSQISGGPVTPEEAAKYQAMLGAPASPDEAARREREAAVLARQGGPASTAMSNPSANPEWSPERERAATAAYALDTARKSASPQAPPAEPPDESAAPAVVPSAPAQYIAPHWQPGTRSETSRATLFDPNRIQSVQDAQNASVGHGIIAGEKHVEAAKRMAEADVAYSVAHEEASRKAAADLARIDEERRAYVDTGMQKLNDLSVKASAKVDPEAAKGPAGAQILAAISIGLGQFGASLNGGPNTALQIVNTNIDRNIRAQEFNINNARQTLNDEKSLYKENLEAFGDRQKAVLATKIQYLDQVKAISDQQYAKAKSTLSEAQKAEFDQKVFAQRSELEMQLAKSLAVTTETSGNERYVPGQYVGGGVPAQVGEKGKEDLFVPSLGVYARSKEEAIKMRDMSARTQNTVRELESAKKIIEESKDVYDPRKLRAMQRKLDGIAARATVTATVKEGQGAMSDGDKAVSEAGLGLKGINLFASKLPGMAGADEHIEVIQSAVAAHKQEYGRMGSGAQRGREVYVRDPKTGNVEARRVLEGSNAPLRDKVDDTSDLIQPPVGQSSRKK